MVEWKTMENWHKYVYIKKVVTAVFHLTIYVVCFRYAGTVGITWTYHLPGSQLSTTPLNNLPRDHNLTKARDLNNRHSEIIEHR